LLRADSCRPIDGALGILLVVELLAASRVSLAKNEQIKLTAACLNGLAIAILAVGSSAPFFSFLYQPTGTRPFWLVALVSAICVGVSADPTFGSAGIDWENC
jgi:hypothetical protein